MQQGADGNAGEHANHDLPYQGDTGLVHGDASFDDNDYECCSRQSMSSRPVAVECCN
ncbi:hypothetical protein D3C80_2193850 [compost metagenome]